MVVVAVEPGLQRAAAGGGRLVGADASPLLEEGPVELRCSKSRGQWAQVEWGELDGSVTVGNRSKHSPEFKEAAVREVIDKSRPIADVARENGLVAQTLGNWVNAWRAEHAGEEPELTLTERARLKELEREVRELRMENEFLGKATAFFAKKHR
jgi:transposase